MLIAALMFVSIFAIAALLLSLGGAGAAEEKKRTQARLAAMTLPRSVSPETPVDLRKRESMSSIPLLNRWLARAEITPKLRDLLSQANISWTPARLLLTSAACCFIPGYLIYLRTGAALVSAIAGALAGAVPFMYVLFKRAKRFDQFEQGLPAALDLMVSGLRSGHSTVSAMSLVARETPDPIGREFRICFDEQNYGLELRAAMHNLARRVPVQDVRIVVTAILIQKETGGNLAEVLDRCSHVIRERFRLKKEIRIKTAQGRLTGLVLTLLPVILGFLLYLVNPKHISLLWTRPLGLKMLYASSIMTIVGGLIIRKIVRIRV
jgi:tight adherence protein B